MAYRRPAIEIIQEFQQAAAALALPSLPACVVGPAFQIVDDASAGTYSEADVGATAYEYPGLAAGAVVDLGAVPQLEADANAHKAVGVKLKNLILVKVDTLSTGRLESTNVFRDNAGSPFAGFDPAAAGAPTYYVEIVSGGGINAADLGRKLVTGKNSSNELVLAAEWQSGGLPVTGVTYRILQFREEEVYEAADFGNYGITAAAEEVTIQPGLTTKDGLEVADASVYLSWRALRTDLGGALTAFTDLDSLEAVFGVGSIVPANVGPYIVNLALQNTTTEISFTGLGAYYFSNEEQAYQTALEFLESKDVYGIAICTQLPAVHQLLSAHVTSSSSSTVGRERIAFLSRKLVTSEVIVPTSGIGTVTTAGASNGTSGTNNKTFRDPTNGAFVTNGVQPGYLVEILDYTAAAGVDRSITPNERDYLDNTGELIRLTNGAFSGGDVSKYLLVQGATTAANNGAYQIADNLSTAKAELIPAPSVSEVLPGSAKTWVAALSRAIAHDNADGVVAGSKTWTFANGAFTSGDIGRLLVIDGAAAPSLNTVFTIATIVSSTSVTTVETPGASETFGGGVTQDVFAIDRLVSRDIAADSVDGATRIWTIYGGNFTEADLGRALRVAGASNLANDADHIIDGILGSNQVHTTSDTTPVTEEFNGLSTPTLGTLDVVALTPNSEEDEAIKSTHVIASVSSESLLVLASDPTGGFGGTLNAIQYRIVRNLTKNEQADFLAGYATSFANRRIVSMWPDALAVSVNGTATKVPGYYAGGALVGMIAGLPSQQGFTNIAMVGFIGREHSNDYFSDVQLDTISGGGNMVLVQAVPDAPLTVRHQLTTDVSTIYFQELSVTKNVDLISRFFRGLYRPFIGTWNITEGLFDALKTRGEGGITFLKNARAQRIGAPLRQGQLTNIVESITEPDTVEIDIDVSVPLPLNNLRIRLLV